MKRLALLDYGRFIAAICVISFHYFFNGIHNGKISSISFIPEIINTVKYGYLGVEFFFMISGYVIFFSAKDRKASDFIVSRVTRLYPAFWAAAIFTSIISYFWGGKLMTVTLAQFFANLSMFPNLFKYGFIDGVYWTLNVEIKFYLLIFTLLLLGFEKKLSLILTFWPFAMLIALKFGKQHAIYLGEYYCFFAAGCLFAILKERSSKIVYISLITCLYLCLQYSTSKSIFLADERHVDYDQLIISIIILSQFIFFLFLNSKQGSSLNLPGAKIAGALTYPVYLIHAHFGYMLMSTFANDSNKAYIYILTLILVLSTSYAIHYFIENKCNHVWKKLFSYTIGNLTRNIEKRI